MRLEPNQAPQTLFPSLDKRPRLDIIPSAILLWVRKNKRLRFGAAERFFNAPALAVLAAADVAILFFRRNPRF